MDPNTEPHSTVLMTNQHLRAQDNYYTVHWRPSGDSKYLPYTVNKYREIEGNRVFELGEDKQLFARGIIKKDPRRDYDRPAAFKESAISTFKKDREHPTQLRIDSDGFTIPAPNPKIQYAIMAKNVDALTRSASSDTQSRGSTKPQSCPVSKQKNPFGLLSTIEEELSPV